jgi:hypothetical protein
MTATQELPAFGRPMLDQFLLDPAYRNLNQGKLLMPADDLADE